jgi:adenosine deaminase CECR1
VPLGGGQSAVLVTTTSSLGGVPSSKLQHPATMEEVQPSKDAGVGETIPAPDSRPLLSDAGAAAGVVAAHDACIRARDPFHPVDGDALDVSSSSVALYEKAREELVRREAVLAFDHPATSLATPLELRASRIVAAVRARDDAEIYATAPPRSGFGGQPHRRYAGDHFLSNADDLIPRTGLFRIASRMPKGAHLHIHFNACLKPGVLLGLAAKMDRMYLTSSVALVADSTLGVREDHWRSAMIEFSILSPGKERERPGDIFDAAYEARATMKFSDFLARFPEEQLGIGAMDWLESKITFGEEEVHSLLQTSVG